MLWSKGEFCKTWLSGCYAFLRGLNEFLAFFSTFFIDTGGIQQRNLSVMPLSNTDGIKNVYSENRTASMAQKEL
jgi:hypothetical protein